MKHKHADNMKLYWEDAMETDKPWERWEMKYIHPRSRGWDVLGSNPKWDTDFEYRRKHKTILVNGIEVPAPEMEKLKKGTEFYVPMPAFREIYAYYVWCGCGQDEHILSSGLVYLNKEDAIAKAKAMMKWEDKND